jgi:hypothetical protein
VQRQPGTPSHRLFRQPQVKDTDPQPFAARPVDLLPGDNQIVSLGKSSKTVRRGWWAGPEIPDADTAAVLLLDSSGRQLIAAGRRPVILDHVDHGNVRNLRNLFFIRRTAWVMARTTGG